MIDLSVAKGLTIVSVMIENQTVGTIAADGQTATVDGQRSHLPSANSAV